MKVTKCIRCKKELPKRAFCQKCKSELLQYFEVTKDWQMAYDIESAQRSVNRYNYRHSESE